MSPASHAPRSVHQPVMVREVLKSLQLAPGLMVVDGTVGGAGHSRKILEQLGPAGRLIGLDRDAEMLARARAILPRENVTLVHDSYAHLRVILDSLNVGRVDRILIDLGLSSDQLADDARGFSFDAAGPLDLRFDTTEGRPAWQRLQDWDEEEIETMLREFGEEPHSRRIASNIVKQRSSKPIRTARELADLVTATLGARGSKERHPATRTFQALRIAVNRELEHVKEAVCHTFPECLKPGGLLAVIAFHSLEDRIVKEAFREQGIWENLTPKPIEPTPQETRFNPRSRSAKLRIARRGGRGVEG